MLKMILSSYKFIAKNFYVWGCTFTPIMKKFILISLLSTLVTLAWSQDKGVISGNFQSNFSVFVLDSSIGAYEPPQYTSDISSSEAWLFIASMCREARKHVEKYNAWLW